MGVTDFALPDLGEGLTESQVVAWRVHVGETVALNQTIAEVETAKALVELPSPYAGTVSRLYAEEGDTVRVGQPLLAFETEADVEPEQAAQPNLVGYGAEIATGGHPTRKPRRLPVDSGDQQGGEREFPQPSAVDIWRTPIAGVRKHTAQAMVDSAFTAPHASTQLTVDVTRTLKLLRESSEHGELAGTHVTILTAAAKALCIAVRRTPEVNTRWDGEAGQIVHFARVNLGIAAATPRGLMVPNIKDAGSLSLAQLADALAELVRLAKAGRLGPEDLSDGTISITNVGVFGVDSGRPILNPGEAAILALGAIRRRPWDHKGRLALRDVMSLTLSFDHRLVDGEQAAGFLADIGRILTDPAAVIAMV